MVLAVIFTVCNSWAQKVVLILLLLLIQKRL